LPGDSAGRLDDGLRRALEAVDPTAAGWESEALVDAVHERLGDVRAWFEGASDTPPAWSWVGPSARFEAWPDTGEPGASGEPAEPGEPSGTFQPVSSAAPGGLGPEGLAGWFDAWRELANRRLKLKVVGVDMGAGEVRTTVRVELFGERSSGPIGGVGDLELAWSTQPLRALGGTIASLELVATDRILFADRSRNAFGARFDEQLAPSLVHWQRRIPSNLGISFLGHQGFALGDVDGDRIDDLFVCQPGGLPNLLFVRRPDGTTDEVGRAWGVDGLDASRAALLVDLDGDGDRDLALTLGSDLVCCENVGGRFEERWSETVGVSTSLAAGDVDQDGALDVYVCGYVNPYADETSPRPYHDARNGAPNRLFRNRIAAVDGERWHFIDATAALGLDAGNDRFSFAATFEDVDEDGDLDLYVANDFGRNNLYRNDGGTFRDVAGALGVEDQAAGMGVSFGDANADGRLDLYVSNMESSAGRRVVYQRRFRERQEEVGVFARHARGNTLFLADAGEDLGFRDAGPALGARRARWAWGGLFCELDNDGRPDLVVPNGFVTGSRRDDL